MSPFQQMPGPIGDLPDEDYESLVRVYRKSLVDHVVEVTHDKPMLNAVRCGICGGPGDRYPYHFQCRDHKGHFADLVTGIWDDHTYQEKDIR